VSRRNVARLNRLIIVKMMPQIAQVRAGVGMEIALKKEPCSSGPSGVGTPAMYLRYRYRQFTGSSHYNRSRTPEITAYLSAMSMSLT